MIEAGLGGRLDATNVLPSRVTVLTSIGLEHTEYLGDDRARDRRREAGRAARPHDPGHRAALAGGRGAGAPGGRRAQRPDRHRARPRRRGRAGERRRPTCAATSPSRWRRPRRCSDRSTPSGSRGVAAELDLRGRMEVIDGDPPLVLDAAHNPAGAAALAEALPAIAGGRPVIALPGGARRQGRRRRWSARWPRRSPASSRPRCPPTCSPRAGRPGARALEACRPGRGRTRRRARLGWRRRPTRRRRSPGRASSPTPRAASSWSPARTTCSATPATQRRSSRRRNSRTSRLSQSVWSLVQPSRSLK